MIDNSTHNLSLMFFEVYYEAIQQSKGREDKVFENDNFFSIIHMQLLTIQRQQYLKKLMNSYVSFKKSVN